MNAQDIADWLDEAELFETIGGEAVDLLDDDLDEELDDLEFAAEADDFFDESTLQFDEFEAELYEDPAVFAEALREALHEDYSHATPEQLYEALDNMWESMTSAEAFNFNKILRNIGRAGKRVLRDPVAGQIAKTVLPAGGAALGTIIGGPVGTALGAKLGKAAGSAFRAPTPRQQRAPGPRAPAAPTNAGPQAGSTAATQLLQLTRNPDVLKSLLALSLGAHGRQKIPVAGAGGAVPVGAVMRLLQNLAGKAAADAEALLHEAEDPNAYLLDAEGNLQGDPDLPESRKDALYDLLADAESARLEEGAERFADALTSPWGDRGGEMEYDDGFAAID